MRVLSRKRFSGRKVGPPLVNGWWGDCRKASERVPWPARRPIRDCIHLFWAFHCVALFGQQRCKPETKDTMRRRFRGTFVYRTGHALLLLHTYPRSDLDSWKSKAICNAATFLEGTCSDNLILPSVSYASMPVLTSWNILHEFEVSYIQ